MVKLNKIYTRTGDDGTTGLATGARVAKHHLRIKAYGTVDETNAALGLVAVALQGLAGQSPRTNENPAEPGLDLKAMVMRIQNDLFDLGADLSTPETPGTPVPEHPPLRITGEQVARLEREIDEMNQELQPLTSFVLPGGNQTAAYLHLARTISRRAERCMFELREIQGELVSDEALEYINRLSDHLFVMSRYVNDKGLSDVLWTPGQYRK